MYQELVEKQRKQYSDELDYLTKRTEELEKHLSIFTDDSLEYSTRKEFLDENILQNWLLGSCEDDPDDELQFSKTNRELKLKIKSVIEDGYINITFTKEHVIQEVERLDKEKWEVRTIPLLKSKFNDWLDNEIIPNISNQEGESQEIDNKLVFRFRNVLVDKEYEDDDLYIFVEQVENPEQEGETNEPKRNEDRP